MPERNPVRAPAILLAALFAFLAIQAVSAAGPKPTQITVAYLQQWPTPSQFAQAKQTFDYALDLKLNWVAFDNGEDMNAAMASGDVQIAYSQGLEPFIFGVTAGLDLNMVGIAVSYPENDNCIVRDDAGIPRATAVQLEGRKIATRVGSISHYRLLKVLAHLGVDPDRVEIVAMPDGAAAARALQQGEVTMACASGSALRSMTALGIPLLSGAAQEAIGLRLFDIVTVPTAFVEKHPEIVQAFVDVIGATNQQWRKNPDPMRAAIARAADMKQEASNLALQGFRFPSAEEQKSIAWMGGLVATYTRDIANFYVAQGRLDRSLDGYDSFITTEFLRW
jgi:taurine transport system substrate-binding protein